MDISQQPDRLTAVSVSDTTDIYERSNLTRLQLLYWVGQKLRSDCPLFNSTLNFNLHIEINPSQFVEAFRLVVAGSDALRTVFDEIEGVPHCHILDLPPAPLQYLDFSQEAAPLTKFQTWRQHYLAVPFDLTRCAYNAALVKLAPDHFVWLLNLHHSITDAASSFLVFNQVKALYEELIQGKTAEIPQLPPFQDYVTFERAFRISGRYPKAAAYWQQRLKDGIEPLKFYGRIPHKQSAKIQRITHTLDSQQTHQLRLAAERIITSALTRQLAFSNLLAALFFVQLHRMTGNHRLAAMMPFHNRPTKTFRGTIGLLMELCPLPVEIAEDETFVSLVGKINQDMQRILLHYQYGTELILQNKAVEIAFNYVNRPSLTFQNTPIPQELIHVGYGNDLFGLHIHDFEGSDSLLLNFDFHEDVFTPQEREQTIKGFLEVVEAFLADNGRFIHDLASVSSLSPNHHNTTVGAKQPFLPPRDSVELQLQQLWQEVIGVEQIGIKDKFFELGGSSWLAMRLFTRIEKATGHYFPLATLLQADTIEKQALILRQQHSTTWSSLVTIQEGQKGKRPFFCVPGAAGNSLVIARIARHLHPHQPVYTFLIPGLLGDHPPLAEVEQQAQYYLNILRQAQPQGPYLIGGYSVGGVVAFEMAQQLLAQGEQVALLAIIDVPIQSQRLAPWRNRIQQMGNWLHLSSEQQRSWFLFIRDLSFRFSYWTSGGLRQQLRQQRTKLRAIIQELQAKLRGETFDRKATRKVQWEGQTLLYTPPPTKDADSSQLEDPRVKALFELNDRAVRSYIPTSYSDRIDLFKSAKGYSRPDLRTTDPTMGWGAVAQGGIEVHEAPGGHLAMVNEPLVGILGKKLNQRIERVQESLE